MIVVNAVVSSSKEDIEAMKGAIARMEVASREETGCHDYTFSIELNDPSVMRITERMESCAHTNKGTDATNVDAAPAVQERIEDAMGGRMMLCVCWRERS